MAKLTDEQQALAARVQEIITSTHPDGSFKYTKEECRAFIVRCIIDLGLPFPRELEGVFERFLEQIGVQPTATEADVVKAIQDHFAENPLNPQLVAEMQALARSHGIEVRDDFERDAAAREAVARVRGAGRAEQTRAPEVTAPKAAPPKLKKGLSG